MYDFYINIIRQIADKCVNVHGLIEGDMNRLLDNQRMDQPYPVLFADDPVIRLKPGDSSRLTYDCTLMLLDTVESENYDYQQQLLSNLATTAKEIGLALTIELYNLGVDAVGEVTIDPIRENTPDNLIGWGINFQFAREISACLNPQYWNGEIESLDPPFQFKVEAVDLQNISIPEINDPPGSTINWIYQLDGSGIIEGNPQENSSPANSMLIQAELVIPGEDPKYGTIYLRNKKGYWFSIPGKILNQ